MADYMVPALLWVDQTNDGQAEMKIPSLVPERLTFL